MSRLLSAFIIIALLEVPGPGLVVPAIGQSASLAPYLATPPDVVERMLTLGRTDRSDIVYDIGCGDGRIVIAAARKYGARGVGIDIDPQRIQEATANAKSQGVFDRVKFM